MVSPLHLHQRFRTRSALSHAPPPSFCLRQSAAVQPGTDAADATAAESTLPIQSMKESGSLELEPSVSLPLPGEPEKAATMPVEASRAQTVLQEGPLGRKHDVEGSGKKSSNRWTAGTTRLGVLPSLQRHHLLLLLLPSDHGTTCTAS